MDRYPFVIDDESQEKISQTSSSSSSDFSIEQISQSFFDLSLGHCGNSGIDTTSTQNIDFDAFNSTNNNYVANSLPNHVHSFGVCVANDLQQGNLNLYPTMEAMNNPQLVYSNIDSNVDSVLYARLFLEEATTLEGSKAYVNELKFKNPQITHVILKNARLVIYNLMTNEFGCHVFMALIEVLDDNQRKLVVEDIVKDPVTFVNVAVHRYGTQSVKKLIKVLRKSSSIRPVIYILSSVFCTLMTHQTGWHVINYCVEMLKPQQIEALYQKAVKHCVHLAIHEMGCISLSDFINQSKGHYRSVLLNIVSIYAVFLSYDPIGNFVLQNVLKLENPFVTKDICHFLYGHYANLSLLKYGSHVAERCLRSDHMYLVVEDLMNSENFVQIAQSKYGNYVIQTALKQTKVVDRMLYIKLLWKISQLGSALNSGYAKNIKKLIIE